VSDWLARYEAQRVIFAHDLDRVQLLKARASGSRSPLRVFVHRNFPFEYIARAAGPFLSYAGYQATVEYSDYDDSLSSAANGDADLVVVALDFERYRSTMNVDAMVAWFGDRLRSLRSTTTDPMLVLNWAATDVDARMFNQRLREEIAPRIASLAIADAAAVAAQLGDAYADHREVDKKGTWLSEAAILETARQYGLTWLPAAVAPRLKAVVLDFDNTLYSGVLGEDGVDGVRITPAHQAIYGEVLRLRVEGLFIAGLSRNEASDVDAFVQQRSEFDLKHDVWSAMSVSWGAKADGLRAIAQQLRIGIDSILFIDDNPGELAAASSELPGLHTVYAREAEETAQALRLYPRLNGYIRTATDSLRADDLAASSERNEALAAAADPTEYLRSLDIELEFHVNDESTLTRAAELSNKTNQFNSRLRRFSESEVTAAFRSGDLLVATVGLSDRLSDSGIIAAIFGHHDHNTLVIDEINVSCRALGRELENAIVWHVVQAFVHDDTDVVAFDWQRGPRNAPALDWLGRWGHIDGDASRLQVRYADMNIDELLHDVPATIVDTVATY
jgi:FkbH-like protein